MQKDAALTARFHDSTNIEDRLKKMNFNFAVHRPDKLEFNRKADLCKNIMQMLDYELNNNQLAVALAAALRLEFKIDS